LNGRLKNVSSEVSKIKPTAIIDVDETLWNSSIVMYNTARALGYEFPVPSDWTHWNIFWEYVPKEKMFPVFDAVHSAQNNHPPYLEAEDFLDFMRRNYHVIIASHRDPKYHDELEQWLRENNLQYDEVSTSFDKTELFRRPGVEVVVDDRDETLEIAASNGLLALGLRKPWNRVVEDKIHLFWSLNDIVEYLMSQGVGKNPNRGRLT